MGTLEVVALVLVVIILTEVVVFFIKRKGHVDREYTYIRRELIEDKENVVNVEGCFRNCTGLTSIDTSTWNTDNVEA